MVGLVLVSSWFPACLDLIAVLAVLGVTVVVVLFLFLDPGITCSTCHLSTNMLQGFAGMLQLAGICTT